MTQRLQRFRSEHDKWRRALVNEPRGNDVLVGALLCEPEHAGSVCGVIFFNNVGYLGMCGHGTIGLVATLAYLGRITSGVHAIDTPVGTVKARLHEDGSVTVDNVQSYRLAHDVPVHPPGYGLLHGDVAWGGNWFFLCHDHGLAVELGQISALTSCAQAVRKALSAQGITGADGAEIDHIELLGPAHSNSYPRDRSGRSFVLCPGAAYDRSPCGTGTSAKLACLAADGALAAGEVWHQESVIGSVFKAQFRYTPEDHSRIYPSIQGTAHVILDAQMVFDSSDSFAWGLSGA